MKKTLTSVLALLTMGAATLYAEEDLTQTAVYTTTTGMENGQGTFNANKFTFTLKDSYFSGTVAGTNILTTSSNGATTFGAEMTLTSMRLVSRQYATFSAAALAIYNGDTLVATSVSSTTASVVNKDIFNPSSFWTRNTVTYEFSGTDVLAKDTVYTVKYLDADGAEITTTGNDTGLTVVNAPVAGMSIGGNESYQPAGLVIVTKGITPSPVVPEPATATLSLLALAGLAARRRRK